MPIVRGMTNKNAYEMCYWIDRREDDEGPWRAADYVAAGMTAEDAALWDSSWVLPGWAPVFAAGGMDPEEAMEWGLHPVLALGYGEAGIRPAEGRLWAEQHVGPEEVRIWTFAGYDFESWALLHGEHSHHVGSPLYMMMLLWAVTGIEPAEALEHVRDRVGPERFLWSLLPEQLPSWAREDEILRVGGFTVEDEAALLEVYRGRAFGTELLTYLWPLTGLHPSEALEHARGGCCPTAFFGRRFVA